MSELEGVIEPVVKELIEFLLRLAEQSDRALVILAAARLDVGLERLLKRVMHHHPGGDDNLFDPDRPLGTFSAKIALAYRLGVIGGNTEHALQMIRKIRNDFAHTTERVDLIDPGNRCRVIEMSREAEQHERWEGTYKMLSIASEGADDDTRTRFCATVAVILAILTAAEYMNKPITINYPADLTWS